MPINTHGSGIRVETNVNGITLDNDEWVVIRSQLEHQPTDPLEDEQKLQALQDLYGPPPSTVAKDQRIDDANINDLRTRNIQQ